MLKPGTRTSYKFRCSANAAGKSATGVRQRMLPGFHNCEAYSAGPCTQPALDQQCPSSLGDFAAAFCGKPHALQLLPKRHFCHQPSDPTHSPIECVERSSQLPASPRRGCRYLRQLYCASKPNKRLAVSLLTSDAFPASAPRTLASGKNRLAISAEGVSTRVSLATTKATWCEFGGRSAVAARKQARAASRTSAYAYIAQCGALACGQGQSFILSGWVMAVKRRLITDNP